MSYGSARTDEAMKCLVELTHTSITLGLYAGRWFLTLVLVVLLQPGWCNGPEHVDSPLLELNKVAIKHISFCPLFCP